MRKQIKRSHKNFNLQRNQIFKYLELFSSQKRVKAHRLSNFCQTFYPQDFLFSSHTALLSLLKHPTLFPISVSALELFPLPRAHFPSLCAWIIISLLFRDQLKWLYPEMTFLTTVCKAGSSCCPDPMFHLPFPSLFSLYHLKDVIASLCFLGVWFLYMKDPKDKEQGHQLVFKAQGSVRHIVRVLKYLLNE